MFSKVQTRQWSCDSYPTCVCGVVVRDHNDVIEISCCNDHLKRDHTTPLAVRIRSKKCLSPGISMKRSINGRYVDYEVSVYFNKNGTFLYNRLTPKQGH